MKTDADVLLAVDQLLYAPDPPERLSTLPPPPNNRTRATERPGARMKGRGK